MHHLSYLSIVTLIAVAANLFSQAPALAVPLSMEASELFDNSGSGGDGSVATDGNGTWVSAYLRDDEIRVSRSTDNAATWSVPQVILTGGGQTLDLAGDGLGNWMLVWSTTRWFGNSEVSFSRSSDNGATWSSAAVVDAGAPSDFESDHSAVVEADGAGRWIVAWQRSTESYPAIMLSASDDVGSTWTLPQTIANTYTVNSIAIAADGAGNWITSWASGPEYLITGEGIGESHSSDGGNTWSAAQRVDANTFSGGKGSVSIATDRNGLWLLAYEQMLDSQSRNQEIFVVRSLDAGATWTAPVEIDSNASLSVFSAKTTVRMVFDAVDETWVAFWGSDQQPFGLLDDYEILFARSADAGATWSRPAMANPEGDGDGGCYFDSFDAATDGAGTWTLVYPRYIWEDFYDVQLIDMRRSISSPDCSAAPLPTCNAPTVAKGSSLKIVSQKGGKDSVRWRWSRGAPTNVSQFGDPATDTDYVFCLYDYAAGVPELVFEKDVLAGETCGDDPCWEAASDGFRYADSKHALTSVARADLFSDETGRAKLGFTASGSAVAPPAIPLVMEPRALVQLVNLESGDCWEASYTEASVKDDRSWKARSSAP